MMSLISGTMGCIILTKWFQFLIAGKIATRMRVWDRAMEKSVGSYPTLFHNYLVSRKAVTFQATRSR